MSAPQTPTPVPPAGGEPTPGAASPRADLQRRLRAAVADRYDVERELDHGGMGTVFLARDLRHGRPIALKVLHPELTHALGIERFLREIRTAGRLMHPHILPLHDSGEADGLLFYTMPYVEGESLRSRLRREGRLPVAEALRIAREVAEALAYAHGLGILHRDIKPENILLAHGSKAVLADFGLARAVHTAANRRITPTGLAIGSPVYMSPEQAAGVKEVDARSDVYSLGCVLYEMLAGEPPFLGASAGEIVRRKISGAPASLRSRRKEVPAAVERVVRQAMGRVPEARFGSATEMAEALAAASAGRARWPAWQWAALGAGGLLVLLLAVFLGIRFYRANTLVGAGEIDPGQPILLADFQPASPGDSTLAGMAGVLLRTDLSQSRLISLVGEGRVREALRRMERPDGDAVGPELAREMAIREGIPALILPRLVSAGGRFVLLAEVVSAASGNVLATAEAIAADSADLVPAVDELSRALRQRIGETFAQLRASEPLARVTTASLPALRRYTQGLEAQDEGDFATAIALYQEAIALDSTFASAHHSLGMALQLQEEQWDRAIEAYRRAYELRDRLPEDERYWATAGYAEALGDWEGAIRAYNLHLEHDPRSAAALNNIGVVYASIGDHPRAAEYYERAWEADSTESLYGSNLVHALHSMGETERAEALNRRMAARFPDFANVPNNASLITAARGDYARAEALATALREAQRDQVSWRIWTGMRLGYLAAIQGRMAEAEEHFEQVMREEAERDTPPGYVKTAAVLGSIDAHARRRPGEAVARVEEALARYPLSSVAFRDRPYPELARIYVAAGRVDRARRLLAEMEASADPQMARIVGWFRPPVIAAIAMGEGRPGEALRALAVPVPSPCPMCKLPVQGAAHEAAGQPDSAIAAYEAYLSSTYVYRVEPDAVWLAHVLERLAALHEARGDARRAAESLRRLVDLWRGADAELQPRVRAAERKLRELESA